MELGYRAAILLSVAALAPALTLEEAARDVGKRIAARLSPRETIRLQVRTRAPGPDPRVVERVLTQLLRSRMQSSPQATAVLVTLARNSASRLLVAELRRTDQPVVLMSEFEDDVPAAPFAVVVDRRLLWEHKRRLLDAIEVDGGWLVLDEDQVALYREAHGQWKPLQATSIARDDPWPRDLRGQLVVRESEFEVFLPQAYCRGALKPQWRVECQSSARLWPLTSGVEALIVEGRNHFVEPRLGPIFAAAPIGDALVVAHAYGGTRLHREAGAGPVLDGVGTELTAVAHPCAREQLLLASDSGGTRLRAYRVTPQGITPLSQPIEMGGVVSALRPEFAVVRQSAAASYAAYRLSTACRQ
jgi:hypothetical protein